MSLKYLDAIFSEIEKNIIVLENLISEASKLDPLREILISDPIHYKHIINKELNTSMEKVFAFEEKLFPMLDRLSKIKHIKHKFEQKHISLEQAIKAIQKYELDTFSKEAIALENNPDIAPGEKLTISMYDYQTNDIYCSEYDKWVKSEYVAIVDLPFTIDNIPYLEDKVVALNSILPQYDITPGRFYHIIDYDHNGGLAEFSEIRKVMWSTKFFRKVLKKDLSSARYF